MVSHYDEEVELSSQTVEAASDAKLRYQKNLKKTFSCSRKWTQGHAKPLVSVSEYALGIYWECGQATEENP